MASRGISPNRAELLRLKNKLKTAERGHRLLKKKRDGLIMDFFEMLENAKDLRSEMVDSYSSCIDYLKKTRLLNYDLDLKVYSKTTKGRNLVDFGQKNIMGLSVPQIKSEFSKRNLIERNNTVYSTESMDETIQQYEDLIEKIIIVAEVETALFKLLEEIEKTKRRVNGLEFNVVPQLKEDIEYVKLSLDEQERENNIKLKKIKNKLEAEN